jgi:hypothetical protein
MKGKVQMPLPQAVSTEKHAAKAIYTFVQRFATPTAPTSSIPRTSIMANQLVEIFLTIWQPFFNRGLPPLLCLSKA